MKRFASRSTPVCSTPLPLAPKTTQNKPISSSASPRRDRCKLQEARSLVLAIEHVPDHFASFSVHFAQCFALLGAHGRLVVSHFRFRRTALGTAIRKPRFIRLQFELFSANDTGFDRKTHPHYFIEIRFSPVTFDSAFLRRDWTRGLTSV